MLVSENTVNLYTSQMFLAFMAFYDSFAACFFNKGVSHVSKCCISVHTAFKFHFNNGMLNHIKLILIEFKTVCNVWVAFNPQAAE